MNKKMRWVVMNREYMIRFLTVQIEEQGTYAYYYYKDKVYCINYTGKETILNYEMNYQDFMSKKNIELNKIQMEKINKQRLKENINEF